MPIEKDPKPTNLAAIIIPILLILLCILIPLIFWHRKRQKMKIEMEQLIKDDLFDKTQRDEEQDRID